VSNDSHETDPIMEYLEVDGVLRILRGQMQAVLGQRLVGLYLYGSLVWGDFDPEVSDIDLLAAIATEVSSDEADELRGLHEQFASEHPSWYDRIEVQYVSLEGLRTFKLRTSRIAAISPGEPFEVCEVGRHWLLNWYSVQERSITLLGRPPRRVIEPISREEFVAVVREHALAWPEWVQEARSRRAQSYAILTMCRALYACTHGEQPSKPRAARWALAQMPEWASLIEDALVWSKAADADGADTHVRTVAFVREVAGIVAGASATKPESRCLGHSAARAGSDRDRITTRCRIE
jgi:predicted nucleotidyltransferase